MASRPPTAADSRQKHEKIFNQGPTVAACDARALPHMPLLTKAALKVEPLPRVKSLRQKETPSFANPCAAAAHNNRREERERYPKTESLPQPLPVANSAAAAAADYSALPLSHLRSSGLAAGRSAADAASDTTPVPGTRS